jgi:alpha-L-fucosidase
MHYLSDKEARTVEEWNQRIDHFDVENLAKQLESVGARYFFITLGQNSGFYLSPNKTYDRIVGYEPSRCSRRDLVADLYKALEPRNIRLMVYLPAGAPDRDARAMEKLEWRKGPYRNREFQVKWESVIREWSTRWGKHVHGWWFDGCYWPNTMYRNKEAPNFESFAAAARAGNAESLVAFNPGVINPIITVTPYEDYTAGEINDVEHVAARRRDGAQPHMLSYLGSTWSAGAAPRYEDSQIVAWTVALVQKDVVVTYDVPRGSDGLIPEAFLAQLRKIGAAVKEAGR